MSPAPTKRRGQILAVTQPSQCGEIAARAHGAAAPFTAHESRTDRAGDGCGYYGDCFAFQWGPH